MNKRIAIGMVLVLGLALAAGSLSQTQAQPNATTKSYDTIALSSNGVTDSGHFPEVWDLTAGDMTISFTYDGNGLVDESGGDAAHAWAELGVRQVGAGDFNPTWQSEGKGVWLATDYDWTANTFDPDPPGAPTQDMDDKLILQKGGGWGEGSYNLPSTPPAPGNNHRIWSDRDGVDQWQAQSPLMVDGGTYNTDGRYAVVIRLHATSPASGEAYMTVNGLDQGFETDGNWNTMELSPAGMTFSGDMTRMQVFYGLYGYGATHSVAFRDITVEGELAPIHVVLWNDDDNNGQFDAGEEITSDEDPNIKVDVSGKGQFKTGDTLDVPDGTTLTYRLLRGGIAGPWQQATFPDVLVGRDWQLEFATVHVTLWNDDAPADGVFNEDEKITPAEDPNIKVDVSGVGQYQTSDTIHLPPDTDITYRLLRGGIAGPWLKTQFSAGYQDWQLHFATVHVTLWNDDAPADGVFNEDEKITPDEDPNIKVDVSGVGQYQTSNTIHLPPGTDITYRLLRGGIAGPWLKTQFNEGYQDWQVHFATVHVTLWNDDDNDGFDSGEEITADEDPAIKVDVSGVGQYQTSHTIHLPPDTDITYRLLRGGIAGPWLKTQFGAGYTDWQLHFATVHVILFNGAEQLGDPHKVDISGVGQLTTSNIVHLPPNTEISYRLLRGGIAGPWLKKTFEAGYVDWRLEFATVTFKFDLPPDIAAMMSTEISGYGTVPHNGKAHLPPGVNISFRAKRGGWAGGWFQQVFGAGDGTVIWRLKPTYTSAP